MAEVTKPVALNESLNTTDSTPKNIADVLKDKLGDIASAISGGGGGSGGHTIQNASGTNMPQEPTMQFTDAHLTDDSQNDKTKVEVIKSVASADYPSETEDGLYVKTDTGDAVIKKGGTDYPIVAQTASNINYNNTQSGLSATKVQGAIDELASEKVDQSLIATVQPNLTAVKSYAKGEQFVYQGLLYKTTAAISSGGTITIGGNCVLADSVTEQIRALDRGSVSVTADGVKTYATLLNSLFSETDMAKVKDYTKLRIGTLIFNLFGITNNECYFSNSYLNSQLPFIEELRVSSSSYYNRFRNNQFSDLSSTVPSNGTKITLYY